MVWVSFGRRRRRGYGGYPGYGGYGRGYGGGFGGFPRGGGGGGCLRDLFLVETGCCLAEAIGCGPQLVLLGPAAAGLLLTRTAPDRPRAAALISLYRSRISTQREVPCCRMTPSCSTYALEAVDQHGTARGLRLAARRVLRCRPGGPVGADPVPSA